MPIKGKFTKKDGKFGKKKDKDQHKSYGGNASATRCYHYKKEGYTRKVYNDRMKIYNDSKDNGNVAIVQDDYESSEVLEVSSSNSCKEWIMDSGCTWHMIPNKDMFEELCWYYVS